MSSPPALQLLDSDAGVSVLPTTHSGRYEHTGTSSFGLSLRMAANPPPLPFPSAAACEFQTPSAATLSAALVSSHPLSTASTATSSAASPPPAACAPPPSQQLPLPLSGTPPTLPIRPARPLSGQPSALSSPAVSALVQSLSAPSSPPPLPSSSGVVGVPLLPARPAGAAHRLTASSGAILGHNAHTAQSQGSSAPSDPPQLQHRRASADKRPSGAPADLSLTSFSLPRQLFVATTDAGTAVLLSDEVPERGVNQRSDDTNSGSAASNSPTSSTSLVAMADSSASPMSSSSPSDASQSTSRAVSPYASLPSLFPSSSRVRVACELADTERTYVSSLRVLVRLFIEPLSAAAATDSSKRSRAPLSTEQVSVLFSNAKLIFSLNESFHHSLSARLAEWLPLGESEHKVGDVIAQFAPYFKLYSQYCSTFDASQRLLNELSQSNSAFQAYVGRIARKSGQKAQPLASLLIQPIQRYHRTTSTQQQLTTHSTPPRRKQDAPTHSLTRTACLCVRVTAVFLATSCCWSSC